MNVTQTTFEEKGHPTIKVLEDKISVKAIDFSQFRDFEFIKIKSLRLFRPWDNSLLGMLYMLSPTNRHFRKKDDFIFRVNLKDGEHWDYNVTYQYKVEFRELVETLNSKIQNLKADL